MPTARPDSPAHPPHPADPTAPPRDAGLSAALLRAVWDGAADGMRLTDRGGTVVHANPAYCRLVGLPPEQVVGRQLDAAYAPARRATARAKHVAQFDAGRVRARFESAVELWDGRERWFEATNTLLDRPGEAPLLLSMFRDVTDRKRAEDVLRAEREFAQLVLDNIPQGVFWKDRDSRYLGCNRVAARAMGVDSQDAVVGLSDAEAASISADQAAFYVLKDREVMDADAPQYHIAEQMTLADGRTIWLDTNKVPMHGPDGRVVGILGTWEDITDRKRAEGELDRQRRELQLIFDAVPAVIFFKDLDHRIVRANRELVRLLGLPQGSIEGRTDVDLGLPHADQYRRDEDEVVATGRPRRGILESLATADGVRWLLTDKFPHRDETGRIVGVIGFALDVTERRRLEEQFRQTHKMEAVGRLAGGVAHDFNNLLTVINGYADLLLAGLAAGDAAWEPVGAIRDAGERAARLTQQLLAFGRKAVVEPKVLDLTEVVATSAKFLRRLIGEDVTLAVAAGRSVPRIRADLGQLEQVVLNLVVNARDAMPAGGRLTIETDGVALGPDDLTRFPDLTPGRYARLTVADTGCGMTDEVRGQIFEPFFTTKGVGMGSGLGLAVVHGVVAQCGGHIGVESVAGVGTTFRLLFPAEVGAVGGLAPGPAWPSCGTETVLLVEDEDAVRKMARISLAAQGFRVLEAGRGADAVRLAAEYAGPIHILVTDVVMPEMGGRQVAEAVRAARPGLKVLYVSGYTDDAVIRHGIGGGGDAFLQKPFTPSSLARKIREVLDS